MRPMMPINLPPAFTAAPAAAAATQGMGDEVKALGKALRSGDLDGARAAYVEVAKAAPEGATLQAGTPFAAMGKALKAGDIDAAKGAFMEAAKARFGQAAPIRADDSTVVSPPDIKIDDGPGTLHVVA